MKYLILITAFILLSNTNFAYTNSNDNNSNLLSYNDYISTYGVNETSVAIIDIFFDNQSTKTSYLPSTSTKYNNKNLLKALDEYLNKNIIENDLKKELNQHNKNYSDISKETYSNLMTATLKRIKE